MSPEQWETDGTYVLRLYLTPKGWAYVTRAEWTWAHGMWATGNERRVSGHFRPRAGAASPKDQAGEFCAAYCAENPGCHHLAPDRRVEGTTP